MMRVLPYFNEILIDIVDYIFLMLSNIVKYCYQPCFMFKAGYNLLLERCLRGRKSTVGNRV